MILLWQGFATFIPAASCGVFSGLFYKLFSAVTGLDGEKLDEYGARLVTLQRAILIREGKKGFETDTIPEFNFTEPLEADPVGHEVLIPGQNNTAVNARGNVLDRLHYTRMLKEYYHLRGWNTETGLPEKETLESLGLEDIAEAFQL